MHGTILHAVWILQQHSSGYQLFDKVCITHEGRMIYYGPADQAREYFYNMGYEPANRQIALDFLVTVTDPKSRRTRPDFVNVPYTAAEFAEYFSCLDKQRLTENMLSHIKRSASALPNVKMHSVRVHWQSMPRPLERPRMSIIPSNLSLLNLFLDISLSYTYGERLRVVKETTVSQKIDLALI